MKNIVEHLKSQRHRDSTRLTYYRVWKLFNRFFVKLDDKPPYWEERIVLFAAYLVEKQLKSTTIQSYLSAIHSVLWESGLELSEDKCLLGAITRACKLKNDQIIHKLPLSKKMFKSVIRQSNKLLGTQPYLCRLYGAIFAAAYYGLLRIGEIASSPHAILAKNVQIGVNKPKILFVLISSKTHNPGDKPQQIKITSEPLTDRSKRESESDYCPFHLLAQYIRVRPLSRSEAEQFFVFSDNSPITPQHIRQHLANVLTALNLDPSYYSFHGWPAGRAQDLLNLGLSVETIKKIGRWRSNAVFTYLKY